MLPSHPPLRIASAPGAQPRGGLRRSVATATSSGRHATDAATESRAEGTGHSLSLQPRPTQPKHESNVGCYHCYQANSRTMTCFLSEELYSPRTVEICSPSSRPSPPFRV